jgi:hypothetical protein
MATDGSTVPTLQIVHASPGRIRLKAVGDEKAVLNGSFSSAIATLENVPRVEEVRAVPLARSVVLLFDPAAATVEEILDSVDERGIELEEPPEPPPAPDPQNASSLGDWIAQEGAQADRRLSEMTERTLDARTLMPLLFTAFAVRAYVKGPRAGPPWHTLLWYAFDSFTKLRRNGGGG